jgi:hydrogenase-4 membrane subunit HyfE
MSFTPSLLVFVLAVLAIVFALFSVEARGLVQSMYWYIAHSCCLILTYVTYAVAVQNSYLLVWAGLCTVNTWILPFLKGGLKYTAKRIPAETASPRLSSLLLLVVTVGTLSVIGFFSNLRLVVEGNPIDSLDQGISLNLLAALILFSYGIIVLMTRRHLFKMAIGLLVMTAGAHLTLVQMAPRFFSMVEIEILTKVMGTVFAMLYAVRLLAAHYHTTDAGELLDLVERGGEHE